MALRWRGMNFGDIDPEEKGGRGAADGAKHALGRI